ncbi:DUF7159 family protein [Mycobacterium sp. Marseille-P9652]|uniref:DUF7159 family protein n=1 Tax=Mycobacterium sp. Marseille-P9652 TaxID=2654950 RepID=UPI0012E7F812|nr:hypothetical protein [Mycobacterium sp. Marseille-P9652]
MDTVLGLSVTPAAVGWVLAEGHGADGTILDHRELALSAGRGVHAVSTAEQVVDEVLRVAAQASRSDHHVRVVGVTWNDEATAQAALVQEALTDAGLSNVVPVRLHDAIDTLARAIAPVIGYEQTAVCILEHESSTVVMVDVRDDETQTAIKQVRGGFDGLTHWLTGMFERHGWRPGGVVVVGADDDINGLSWQLEKVLPVPVFAQTMAQVTVARGAALAAAGSMEFTDERLVTHVSEPVAAPARSRRGRSYTGAMMALAAGTITFVSSLSVAVGIELAPSGAPATPRHVVHAPQPEVAEAVAPSVAPPPESAAPKWVDGEPVGHQDGGSAVQQPDPDGRQPYLTRVLEHIPGDAGDSASDSAPHAPAQP